MTEAGLKAKELVEKFDEYSFKPNPLFNINYISEFHNAKQCTLIHVKDTLDMLSSMRATKQILKQYRLYTEVKFKIEGIK